MAKRTDLTALMERKKLTPQPVVQKEEGRGAVAKRRTLNFTEADERELDRIEAYLRGKGFSRVATAKLVRIALRVAFLDDLSDEAVRGVVGQVIEEDRRRKG